MPPPKAHPASRQIRLIYLLPNLLTITAICAGLTAIRFGYEGNFEMAVRLILAACLLDGLDGRIARLLKRATPIGAELDSLADFVNFGVAPALILYSWALQDMRSAGWIAVLFYAICCVLRLARFNVAGRLEGDKAPSQFFVGVPSPAGAILVLLPMVTAFALPGWPHLPPFAVAAYICLIGLLMISRIATYSFKNMKIDRSNAKFFLLGAVVLVAALLTYLWITTALLACAYAVTLIWANRPFAKPKG